MRSNYDNLLGTFHECTQDNEAVIDIPLREFLVVETISSININIIVYNIVSQAVSHASKLVSQ